MERSNIEGPAVGDIFRPGGSGKVAAARGPRVLLFLHDDCARCRAWARHGLVDVEDGIGSWGGRVVRLDSRFGAHDPDAAWAAVLDEWDEVFHVVDIGPGHAFPDPADLVEWARFVAIQCPECEAPEGPWRR